MASVKIVDNSRMVLQAMRSPIGNALEKIGLAAERYAKGECRVDTGRLRNSITHAISGESTSFSYTDDNGKSYSGGISAPDDGDDAVYVGTNVEYAPIIETKDHFLVRAATTHPNTYKQIITDEFAKIK